MFKIILFSVIFALTCNFSNTYSQSSFTSSSKHELNKYEFSFSSSDFAKVQTMQTFIKNITMSDVVQYDVNTFKIYVQTKKVLEYNIIYGKFEKQEVELLTFSLISEN